MTKLGSEHGMFLQYYGMFIQDYDTGDFTYPSDAYKDGLEPNLAIDPYSLEAVSGLIRILKEADFRGHQAIDPVSADSHHIQAQFFDGTAHLGLEPREAGVVTVSSRIHYSKPDPALIGNEAHTPRGELKYRSTSASYQRVERDDRLRVRYTGEPARRIDLDVALSLLRRRVELSYSEELVRQEEARFRGQIMGQLLNPIVGPVAQEAKVLPAKVGLVARARQILRI